MHEQEPDSQEESVKEESPKEKPKKKAVPETVSRRNTHRLRHRGPGERKVPSGGLAVICPRGTQLKGAKRRLPNAQCPCGSGKKFKKCCMNKEN